MICTRFETNNIRNKGLGQNKLTKFMPNISASVTATPPKEQRTGRKPRGRLSRAPGEHLPRSQGGGYQGKWGRGPSWSTWSSPQPNPGPPYHPYTSYQQARGGQKEQRPPRLQLQQAPTARVFESRDTGGVFMSQHGELWELFFPRKRKKGRGIFFAYGRTR